MIGRATSLHGSVKELRKRATQWKRIFIKLIYLIAIDRKKNISMNKSKETVNIKHHHEKNLRKQGCVEES